MKLFQTATFNSLHPRSNSTPSFEVEPSPQGGYRLTMSTPTVSQSLQTHWDQNNNLFAVLASSSNPNLEGAWDDPDLTNPTLNWGNNAQQATLAHWTVWRAYQYFKNRFGMNGTDGQGGIGRILIAPTLPDNAFWNYDHGMMVVGSHNGTILSAVDIVAHEYGHGVSRNLVGGWLTTNPETGALNEGFSDIIGTTIERELYPTGGPNEIWNYQIGEDAWLLRDMANPHNIIGIVSDNNGNPVSLRYPQMYQEAGYWDNNNESHHNSTVISKWFHTLTTGSGPNGNNITPISFDDAMQVVYWGLDNYIYGDYNYPNTANALRTAAGAVFGGCSPQQKAVIAALGAVNLSVSLCPAECNFTTSINSINTGCNQAITLSAPCNGGSGVSCLNVLYSFSGPNVPYNMGGSSINITTPATGGSYQYSVSLNKPGCYVPTNTFTVNTSCPVQNPCDFSSGPRYVGTWNGLTVQIRKIAGKNVLVTAIPNSSTDKYYPRGDNFWGGFTLDPGATGLQSCLSAGTTAWWGLTAPSGLTPPSGYYQGTESDGAIFFAQNGTNPPNPCDVSPRHVGTWNGLNVEMRTFANGKHALVTAVVGASNNKYYVRGDNFWDNFTKDAGVTQYQSCLNAGTTAWWGMSFPNDIAPPSGYQQGTSPDGAIYFSTNGLRLGAPEPTVDEVTLVQVHPNPAQDEVTVSVILKEAGDIQIRLLDLQGRLQQARTEKGVAGKNERKLTLGTLATGLYAVEVIFEGQRVIHKLVKE